MERFSSRENVLLGYSPSRSFIDNPSSSSSSFSDAVVDFHDVFGGPPRRVSIQEGRYSFNSDGVEDGVAGRRESDEQVERRRSPWGGGGLGLGGKPVFGEASSSGSQRRKTSDDFFDDIFKGVNTSTDSPSAMHKKRDLYSSPVPAEAILMPTTDAFGSSPHSSMPGKVGKGMDVPMFTSVSSSPRRSRDNYPPMPTVPSSRISRHGSQSDLKNEAHLFYRQSPLSIEFSFANDGSVKVTKTDKGDGEDLVKQSSTICDSLVNSNQFHFSIYKWASKGAPPMIPLRGGVNFRLRDKTAKKSLDDDGKHHKVDVETEEVVGDVVVASAMDNELKDRITSSRKNMKKTDDERRSMMEGDGIVDEDLNPNSEEKEDTSRVPDPTGKPANSIKIISGDFDYHEIRARSKSRIVADLVNDDITEDETIWPERENQKSTLSTAISENEAKAESQTTLEGEPKPKGTTLFSRFASFGSYIKKQDTKGTISDANSDVDKNSVSSSPGESSRRRKVKEKVKEFVEMFNQDSSYKSKMDADINIQSSEWNGKNSNKVDDRVSGSTKRTGKDISKPKLDKKFELSNASEMVDKKFKQATMSTQVDKKKMSPNTYAKVENDTMPLKAEKDMSHITDSVVDKNKKSASEKKETFESDTEDKKINTATKVKMDSAQAKKSSSRSAGSFTDTNLSFPPLTGRKMEAYRNDSSIKSKKTDPTNSYKVDKKTGFKTLEKEDPRKESDMHVRKDTSSKQKDISSPGTGSSLPDLYQDANESLFDPIDAFEIKELTEELSNVSQMDEYQLALQESDAKIRQWSRGKEGNIRSLLSTLQHVLWPGSGWKPVALMDIIEANQVKRTYQRALLCLHPDKLQQKGAAEHQKYIAGKVFDILQESWNHFNTLTSL